MNSLRIHYLFRKFTFKSLSFLRIHFQSTIFVVNLLRIRYLFRESTSNTLSISQIHSQFTIYFANLLTIHYPFREFTINSLSLSPIHILTLYDFMTHYYHTFIVTISPVNLSYYLFYITFYIGAQDHNRRYKLILEIGLSKGVPVSFSPTRPIIFFLHADWLER